MPGFVIGGGPFKPVGGVSTGEVTGIPLATREFYYKYTWEIQSYFEDDGAAGGRTLDGNNPLVYLKDATLPTFTAQVDSIIGTSLEYKWAKSVIWEDIKVTWYDTVGLVDIMKRWRKTIWTKNVGIKPGSFYNKKSQLRNFLPTWDHETAIKWTLHNSWPKIIKHGDLTYTQSDVKLVEVTISYDWAEEKSE